MREERSGRKYRWRRVKGRLAGMNRRTQRHKGWPVCV